MRQIDGPLRVRNWTLGGDCYENRRRVPLLAISPTLRRSTLTRLGYAIARIARPYRVPLFAQAFPQQGKRLAYAGNQRFT